MMRLGPLQSMNTMLPFRECKTLIDPGVVKWLELHALKENWCEYYFTDNRYGHITLNIAESINAWLLDAHEKPILAMLEQIHRQLMD